jgi:hypothetical protein
VTPSPVLFLHICAGTLGLLSGFVAMSFRKGSRGHRVAGNVFVASMLILAVTATALAIVRHEPGNILAGTLTFYLVATAWITARRAAAQSSPLDWGALLAVAALAAVSIAFGIEAVRSHSGHKFGLPPGPYIIFGFVAVIATAGDIRRLARGGVSDAKRIARHLWRMCFAWFIASASIFLARPHLFPAILRKTGALYFLGVLPLLLMIFWLIRVLFRGRRIPYQVRASIQP